jgi:acyl-coenzyme A thioesterase PaaI-like protein
MTLHRCCFENRYRPEPHQAGWPGLLNGGILASLVDCHCVCTAIADTRRAHDESGPDPGPVSFATGSLSISYLRPVPIDATVELTARSAERTPRKTRLECTVVARGELCARARSLPFASAGHSSPRPARQSHHQSSTRGSAGRAAGL